MIDHNKIVDILRGIKDPQSGRDIISAKMVEDFQLDGQNIVFSIVLKTNDSQLKSSLNLPVWKQFNRFIRKLTYISI